MGAIVGLRSYEASDVLIVCINQMTRMRGLKAYYSYEASRHPTRTRPQDILLV